MRDRALSPAAERHSGTAIHSRAGHFNLRTLEILRSVGLEETVRQRSEQQYPPIGGISNVESLAGREIATYFTNLNAGVAEFSPTVRLFVNQDALEPILRARGGTGRAAALPDRVHQAGAGRERRDRGPHRHGKRFRDAHYVTSPVLRGFFRLDRGGNAGFLVVNLIGDIARPEIVAAYPDAPWANVTAGITEDRALELLRAAIGIPGMPLVIEDIATWRAVADLADRFQDQRILLAGDAVHVVPPNGGFGGNTGVHARKARSWCARTDSSPGAPPTRGRHGAEHEPGTAHRAVPGLGGPRRGTCGWLADMCAFRCATMTQSAPHQGIA